MMFWAAAGVMVLMVLGILLQALRRTPPDAAPSADLAVYRDQLREVERDSARGVLSDAEAQRLRAEVSRRLLDADRNAVLPAPGSGAPSRAGIALIVVTLASTVGLYARLGAPDYPDFGLQTRLAFADEVYRNRPNQDQAELTAPEVPLSADPSLIARTEALRAALQTLPDDPETLGKLAIAEASYGDLVAARVAQARLIAVKGPAASANDHATLGWMMITAAGGYVSPGAEASLIAALQKDPQNGLARFYSGLMFAQVGRPDRAFALWRPLLEEGPETAPWIAPIRSSLEGLASRAGIRYALPAAPTLAGPGAEDVAAAAAMTPADRQAMIVSMVEGLEARLATEGGPPEDWAKLIVSLATIDRADQARAILAEARTLFAGEPGALAAIETAALKAGLAE